MKSGRGRRNRRTRVRASSSSGPVCVDSWICRDIYRGGGRGGLLLRCIFALSGLVVRHLEVGLW